MKSYFLIRAKDFIPILQANVFSSVCQLYGITFFWFAENIDDLEKDSLHTSGVYIFIDKQIPIYVGKSKDLANRLKKSHEEYQGEKIIMIECPQKYKKAGYLEEAFRKVFRPVRNKEGERKRR